MLTTISSALLRGGLRDGDFWYSEEMTEELCSEEEEGRGRREKGGGRREEGEGRREEGGGRREEGRGGRKGEREGERDGEEEKEGLTDSSTVVVTSLLFSYQGMF